MCHAILTHHAFDLHFSACRLFRYSSRLLRCTSCATPQETRTECTQTQRIPNYENRAKTHRSRCKHRIQFPSEKRIEHTCCNRNSNYIINKCPEEILPNIPNGRTAQLNGSRNIQQAALHQHNIRRSNGNISSSTDGNPGIRLCQSRCIVDAVSYHGNLFSSRLQGLNLRCLISWQDIGNGSVNACLLPNGFRCFGIVTCQQQNFQPHFLKFCNRLFAGFLNGI